LLSGTILAINQFLLFDISQWICGRLCDASQQKFGGVWVKKTVYEKRKNAMHAKVAAQHRNISVCL
jgi:hypothetical protein